MKKASLFFVAGALIVCIPLSLSGAAQSQTPAPAPAPVPTTTAAPTASLSPVLAEGTALTVQLVRDLYTNNTGQGDPVQYRVSDNVYSTDASHTLMIAKGALGMGRVLVRSKSFGGSVSGKLSFTCEYAQGVDGRRVWLRPSLARTGAVKVEMQVKHGGPGDQLEKGIMRRAAGYPAGTQFTMYVDQDATLQPAS